MTDDADTGAEPGMDRTLHGSSSPTPAASSAGASSPAFLGNSTSVDWCGLGKGKKGGSLSRSCSQPRWPSTTSTSTAGGSTPGSSHALCRPWDRGDLLKRIATFKSSNCFTTPKVCGPLACARRGWVNLDGDLIACEACDVHLRFPSSTAPSSHYAVVEGRVEQLDTGHTVHCPWRGNPCAESLAQFLPSPISSLIGGFDDRCDALLQFSSLPVISGSAIDQMKLTRGPEIDCLFAKPPPFMGKEIGKRVEDCIGTRIGSVDTSNNPYYQAQKLISLCGWEPRFLPFVVDCEEHSAHSTRKAQCVTPDEGPSHRMPEPRMLLPSGASRLDKKVSSQNVTMVSELKCDPVSAVLDCSLCGATLSLSSYETSARPSPLRASSLLELPEPSKKYTGTPMHGTSAASGVEGWCTIETPSKDTRKNVMEVAGDATTICEEKMSSHNKALGVNVALADRSTPPLQGCHTNEIAFSEPATDMKLFIRKSEGIEMGGPVASYESFGPGFSGHRRDDGGSTVDRPHSRMHRADSMEGTVVELEGDEVDDGEAGRKRSCVGESSKHNRGRDSSTADQLSYGLAITDPGCSNLFPAEADFEVDDTDRLKQSRREAILQGLYDHRILTAQPAGNSVDTSSVIALDTSHSQEGNSMESVDNFPLDSDAQGTAFSWEKSENVDDEALHVLVQAQQSTCHQDGGLQDLGVSTSYEGGGIIAVENDAAVFSAMIGMGCAASAGMSGGSVQMGASHEAEIHGADLSVHRMESFGNDTELVTELTEFERQANESVLDEAPTGLFVSDDARGIIGQHNSMGRLEPVPSLSVGKVSSGIKRDDSAQGESWESKRKYSRGIISGYISAANHVTNHPRFQASASGKDCHADAVLSEPEIRGIGEGKGLGHRRSREQGGEFDPIHEHNYYCPWINGVVAAAGTGESNLKTALCGWELTIDALAECQLRSLPFAAPLESESAASMHKG